MIKTFICKDYARDINNKFMITQLLILFNWKLNVDQLSTYKLNSTINIGRGEIKTVLVQNVCM